ncbi:MAG: AlpA family phage regulatory protein [Gammaproteobacteria bacterium]|nr:AlpA family phage regulatory protein [Gammaproteobacteria bacterium]
MTTNHSLSPSRRGVEPRVLRIADLEEMLRVSKRTIYYWIAKGRFPRSDVELGSQLRAWRTETVAAWLESRTVDPA